MLGFPYLFEIPERDVEGQVHCREIEHPSDRYRVIQSLS